MRFKRKQALNKETLSDRIQALKDMHIIWKGQSCFNLLVSQNKGEQITITLDPYDCRTQTKISKNKSDLILSSCKTEKDNLMTGSETENSVFVLDQPGEYEIKDIYIKGVECFQEDKKEIKQNTIYKIEAEGIKVCHLGTLSNKELTPAQIEEIGSVDILLAPVGGDPVIDGITASSIVNEIEPKIVIPMYYNIPAAPQKLEGVEKFLKAIGETSPEKMEKLLIKAKDLPEENTKVIVLTP